MARRKCICSGFLGRKTRRTLIVCRRLHRLWYRSIYRERRTVVCVPIRPVAVSIRSVTVPIQSVSVRLVHQHCVVYCLLPPTLVYFAVLQPGLFSVYCLIHCTTTRTTFSELPQALYWSAIVFSVSRAVISLLPNILWCDSLLTLDTVSWVGYTDQTYFSFLDAVISELLTIAPAHVDKHIWPEKNGDNVCYLCSLC